MLHFRLTIIYILKFLSNRKFKGEYDIWLLIAV